MRDHVISRRCFMGTTPRSVYLEDLSARCTSATTTGSRRTARTSSTPTMMSRTPHRRTRTEGADGRAGVPAISDHVLSNHPLDQTRLALAAYTPLEANGGRVCRATA